MGTQMFLQLVELAEQLLDPFRVLHAGRSLGEHLPQPSHSNEEKLRPGRWHTQRAAAGQCSDNKSCAFSITPRFAYKCNIKKKMKSYADFNLGASVDSCQEGSPPPQVHKSSSPSHSNCLNSQRSSASASKTALETRSGRSPQLSESAIPPQTRQWLAIAVPRRTHR